jgi:hypothetical protein
VVFNVQAEKYEGGKESCDYSVNPDICPLCHIGISPDRVSAVVSSDRPFGRRLQIVYRCPRKDCESLFIAYFLQKRHSTTLAGHSSTYFYESMAPLNPFEAEFSGEIQEVSPSFVQIYNQAIAAESYHLDQVAGMGLRKALEFLIKDFLVKQRPSDAVNIKKALLGPCINNYVDDPRLKQCAERATWLGNDETHYERKWVGQDVKDLKVLIKLTVNWVESALLTELYTKSMVKL